MRKIGNIAASEPIQRLRQQAAKALANRDYRAAHQSCLEMIRIDVHHADAYFLLGVIASDHDNWPKAAELFETTIEKGGDAARAYAHLAKCEIARFRSAEARASADASLRRSPKDAHTLDTLGVVLTRLGDHARARRCFAGAVAKNPAEPGFHYNLAAAQQFTGEFEAAEAGFRRTLELQPGHHHAWSSLSQLWSDGASDDEVAELTRRFEGAGDNADARLHLGHALARHYEQQGEYATSLRWLSRAKRLRRDQVSYRRDEDTPMFEAARRTFTPAASGAATEKRRPIFVVGMPRTGTTLIDRILSSHPNVVSVGEAGELSLAVKRLGGTPSPHVLEANALEAARDVPGDAIAKMYLDAIAPRLGDDQVFVDKMPFNFFYCGVIHRALPAARIVCLRRHPMDACLSNYRQLFSTRAEYYRYAYDLEHTAQFYGMFASLAEFWRSNLPPGGYLELRYEDLVADQRGETERLLAFCSLDWDDACMHFERNSAPVATASSVQVRQPLNTVSLHRWRRYGESLDGLAAALRQAGVNPESD